MPPCGIICTRLPFSPSMLYGMLNFISGMSPAGMPVSCERISAIFFDALFQKILVSLQAGQRRMQVMRESGAQSASFFHRTPELPACTAKGRAHQVKGGTEPRKLIRPGYIHDKIQIVPHDVFGGFGQHFQRLPDFSLVKQPDTHSGTEKRDRQNQSRSDCHL